MKKNLVTFKKGDVVTEAGDLIGMKVVDAAKAGLLVRGTLLLISHSHIHMFLTALAMEKSTCTKQVAMLMD